MGEGKGEGEIRIKRKAKFMQAWVLGSISAATIIYVLGFIVVLTYKRDKINGMEEKLDALNNILDSCDKMIDELNNLSDYIITNIEDKSSKLADLSEQADKKIKELHFHVKSVVNPRTVDDTAEEAVPDVRPKKTSSRVKKTVTKDIEENVEQIQIIPTPNTLTKVIVNTPKDVIEKDATPKIAAEPASSVINAYENNIKLTKRVDGFDNKKSKSTIDTIEISDHTELLDKSRRLSLMLNAKTKEVIELSKQGMDTTDIAKKLGIGKGEIELILSMKK